MTTLEIKNIEGVHDLEIDIPENSGGVLVLKGRNAAGKSTCLKIIRALLGGDGRLACSDGASRGIASGFGRRVSVTSQTRYSGEVDVGSLEGRFDFSDLVVPPAKDVEARDRIRIKALLTLTGAKADPSLFYPLVGGKTEFEKIVPAEALKTDDLVELAGRVHRAIHAAARQKESDSAYAEGHARACREAAGDIDPNSSIDMEELHRQSHDAAAELSRLRERKEHTERNAQAVAEAKAAIATLQQQYTGPTVEQAKAALAEAEERKSAADRRVAELEEQLRKAKEEAMNCRASHAEARADYDAAVNNQEIINQLRERIAGASLDGEPVTELDLRLAEKRVVECRQAVEVGIRTRDAILKAQEAEQHAKRAQGLRRAAEALREAASSVDQVLSTQLPTGPLRAEGGRLVLDTERGQGVPFDECSQGEKYRVALPYGIASVGAGGYLALVQEAWDGLDGEHRAEIAQICKASKVWIITGQVDDGELRAEEFSVQA